MDLSVIIVNWNTKDLLLQSLESVCLNIRGVKDEVFVVDNGSADGSAMTVREKFPEIHLIENKRNLGFARACNQALVRSGGDFVLFLNPDAQLKLGTVGRLLSFMNSRTEAAVAGVQLLHSDGKKQNSIAPFPSLLTELLSKRLLRGLFPHRFPGKESEYFQPIEVDSVIGACMVVRREAFEQVGLLDEDYFLFLEETDWCFRMKQAGWKIYHVPQAEVYHLQGQSVDQDRKRAKLEYYRSRYYFFKKNRGPIQRVLLLAGLVTKLSVDLAYTAVLCIFTLFSIRRWRKKLFVYGYLMGWHLLGCPETMGLKGER